MGYRTACKALKRIMSAIKKVFRHLTTRLIKFMKWIEKGQLKAPVCRD